MDYNANKIKQLQERSDAKLEQIQKILDEKKDRLHMFQGRIDNDIVESFERKAVRIQEYMEMKANAKEQRGQDSKLAQMMRKKFDLEEQRKSSAERYTNMGKQAAELVGVTAVGSILKAGYVSFNHARTPLQAQPNINESDVKLNIKENMKVADETFKTLQDTAKQFNIKWQPTKDDKMLEAVLPEYIDEDHIMFDLVFGGEITDEVELPVGFINGHFNNIACLSGGLNDMDFFEKIGYKLSPKKNHIRKFITTEEAFMEAYNKLISK